MSSPDRGVPLADRMRPRDLTEIVGQETLVGERGFLTMAAAAGSLPSLLLWGPPGCGKTTIARVLARQIGATCVTLSAVSAGVRDVRPVLEQARQTRQHPETPGSTLLFIDEIHRFNRGQQDAFLPFVEDGSITLIGATTEHPSFEITAALLSRCQVFRLNPLAPEQVRQVLVRAVTDPGRGFGHLDLQVDAALYDHIAHLADGDVRRGLNLLEQVVTMVTGARQPATGPCRLELATLHEALDARVPLYDRSGEMHYNIISALHKSLRGSDVDASLYWLARMLAGGEDGLYVARRLIRMAVEDIGNADPQALTVALQARDVYHLLGHPEGELALAQAVVYLATAPKSNSIYRAYQAAMAAASRYARLEPPLHLRNVVHPSTRVAAGVDPASRESEYRYPHEDGRGWTEQEYLPDLLRGTRFYHPVERGAEREIARRLAWWRKIRVQSERDTADAGG